MNKKHKKYLLYAGVGAGALALLALAVKGKEEEPIPEEKVIYRANMDWTEDPLFTDSTKWIAIDNGNGLTSYQYTYFASWIPNSVRYKKVYQTPEGFNIWVDPSAEWDSILITPRGYNDCNPSISPCTSWRFVRGGNADIYPMPKEPYTSNNQEILSQCSFNSDCINNKCVQNVCYTPPNPTCIDGDRLCLGETMTSICKDSQWWKHYCDINMLEKCKNGYCAGPCDLYPNDPNCY